MPVVNINNLWSDSRVPIVYDASLRKQTEPWIQEVNEAVGYELMVEKEDSDTSWIKVVPGKGRSEQIGCAGKGEQTISGQDQFSMQHELMHALGFHHEQLHEDYAWDDSDENITAKAIAAIIKGNGMVSVKKYLKPDTYNMTLYLAIAKGMKNELAADANLLSRYKSIRDKDKLVKHLDPCDYSSIMMYPQLRDAAQSLPKLAPGKKLVKGKMASTNLSESDVKALLTLYKKPRRG